MSADTEFHMNAADIRKRVLQLRAVIDQGDIELLEDLTLLAHVFLEDELEWMEEHEEVLFEAINRVEDQWEAMQEAGDELELSQASLDAMVFVLGVQDEADADADDDRDGDNADPDADLN